MSVVDLFSFETMALAIVTALFLIGYAILISFYHNAWKKQQSFRSDLQHFSTSVSVVIAARNEQENIELLLTDIFNQHYPGDLYEIIVVDDFSTDNTREIITQKFPLVKLLKPHVSPENSSKKIAIATGVNFASGELIVVTDADCRVPENWLSTIASFFENYKPFFIAAPVRFEHNNSLLQRFQALDFLILQGITAASVSSGFHNMCNGANLAYTKQSFVDVKGFQNIDAVASGDDMLLMHKIWKLNPNKISFVKSGEAIVTTHPMKTWSGFFSQRRRWASKTLIYEDRKIVLVLAFVYFFNLLSVILIVFSLLNSKYWLLTLVYLFSKPLIEYGFVSSVSKFYGDKQLLPYLFLYQPLHIFYTIFVGFISQFGKYEWKGRRTK